LKEGGCRFAEYERRASGCMFQGSYKRCHI
jgi:hypothetical protein